jgi:hypothetical protein
LNEPGDARQLCRPPEPQQVSDWRPDRVGGKDPERHGGRNKAASPQHLGGFRAAADPITTSMLPPLLERQEAMMKD